MKKSILLPAFLLALIFSLRAQQRFTVPETKIIYQKNDLDQVLRTAAEENKMVMLQFQRVQTAAYRYTVNHALLNDSVTDFINAHFINLLIDLADTLNYRAVISKYQADGWGFIFLDKNGIDKYRFGGGMGAFDAKHFMEQVNQAVLAKDRNVNDGVVFTHGDIPAALASAEKLNKLVFIDCYTSWCVPCAEMANSVFPLKEMGDYFNPKFVAVKLNMESPEGNEIKEKYKVVAYPTFLILNHKGDEIGRVTGGMDAKPFIKKVAEVLSKNGLPAQGSPNPNNWQLLDYQTDHVYGISANKAYSELLKGRPAEKVIVAVIDGGVDTIQQDLKDVLWRNPKEIPNDGKDNDGDGYTDDYFGWNFLGGKSDTSNVTYDSYIEQRIYFKYKALFENVNNIRQVRKKDRGKYRQWIEARDILVAKAPQTKRARNLAILMKSFAWLQEFRERIKRDTFYLSDVKAYQPRDFRDTLLKTDWMSCLGQVPAGTSNVGLTAAFKKKVDNLRAEARKIPATDRLNNRAAIVKDNEDDIRDRFYGNGNISVPATLMHGTHVAGIIAAERNNHVGMDGVADHVAVMALRAVPEGDEHDKDIALAVRFAVDHGAKVINMSFGKSISPHRKWVEDAFKYALKHDVLLIRAAGNSGEDVGISPTYPTQFYGKDNKKSFSNMITVGASGPDEKDLVAYFSNYGAKSVDVFAPGTDIYSTLPGVANCGRLSGTSMAAPVVAGIAAVLRSYFPRLTAPQVKLIIMQSVQKVDFMVMKPGTIEKTSFDTLCLSGGIANLYNAVKLAEQMNE